ncbi:MAG: ubiquinone-binding protein, partial [Caulobacteraceae bacterium]|nr:ubiquinone-binding protein [Caulobacteraceae bacterium]
LRHTLSRVLPYTPDQLLALVADVDSYPQFVPWITALRTWNRRQESPGISTVDAEAKVGFSFLRERFSTRVRCDEGQRQITVGLLHGPFRKLENIWKFHGHPDGALIEFYIDFEFKVGLLDRLLHVNFDHAVRRLISCFEARAKSLYEPVQPSIETRP